MKSRYCYCPMTAKRIGRRTSLLARIRRRKYAKRAAADMFPVCNMEITVYPAGYKKRPSR